MLVYKQLYIDPCERIPRRLKVLGRLILQARHLARSYSCILINMSHKTTSSYSIRHTVIVVSNLNIASKSQHLQSHYQ